MPYAQPVLNVAISRKAPPHRQATLIVVRISDQLLAVR
jgi:hypothetical protein